MNNKAVSPLIVTILLVLFAIALGAIVMSWNDEPATQLTEGKATEAPQLGLCNPLAVLKIKYVNKEISDDEYQKMKDIVGENN